MNVKEFVKQHISINKEDNTIQTELPIELEGEWELARKSEYKKVFYKTDDPNLFLQVTFGRSGSYHSGYETVKPVFDYALKQIENKTVYTDIKEQKNVALALKEKHFDKYDETKIEPIYESGWQRAEKVNYYETVYLIEDKLLKQTLFGNSDYTELVEYDIVKKEEIQETYFQKIKV